MHWYLLYLKSTETGSAFRGRVKQPATSYGFWLWVTVSQTLKVCKSKPETTCCYRAAICNIHRPYPHLSEKPVNRSSLWHACGWIRKMDHAVNSIWCLVDIAIKILYLDLSSRLLADLFCGDTCTGKYVLYGLVLEQIWGQCYWDRSVLNNLRMCTLTGQ